MLAWLEEALLSLIQCWCLFRRYRRSSAFNRILTAAAFQRAMRSYNRLSCSPRSLQGPAAPFQSHKWPRRYQQTCFPVSGMQCSAAAAGTVNSTVQGATVNSSRDERSTARQTAEAANSILVDGVVVQPAYRSTPWEAEAKHAATATDKAVIMFMSESGICRGPLAAAAFTQLLQHSPLRDCLQVTMRATRDYCEGEPADPSAAAAADMLGFSLQQPPPAAAAAGLGPDPGSNGSSDFEEACSSGVRVFNPLEDIVAADMVLVMDKYTAADVLREVSSYDLINPGGRYSSRVRMLGSFHPQLAAETTTPDGQDIDDALYGNEGGEEEQAAVLSAAKVIVESCRNLLSYFEDLAAANGLLLSGSSSAATGDADMLPAADAAGASSGSISDSDESVAAKFKAVLVKHVQDEGVIEWLVPPMLQGSNVDIDGWV